MFFRQICRKRIVGTSEPIKNRKVLSQDGSHAADGLGLTNHPPVGMLANPNTAKNYVLECRWHKLMGIGSCREPTHRRM